MADEWYYAVGDDLKGAVTDDELRALFLEKKISGETFVFGPGLHEWLPYKDVPGSPCGEPREHELTIPSEGAAPWGNVEGDPLAHVSAPVRGGENNKEGGRPLSLDGESPFELVSKKTTTQQSKRPINRKILAKVDCAHLEMAPAPAPAKKEQPPLWGSRPAPPPPPKEKEETSHLLARLGQTSGFLIEKHLGADASTPAGKRLRHQVQSVTEEPLLLTRAISREERSLPFLHGRSGAALALTFTNAETGLFLVPSSPLFKPTLLLYTDSYEEFGRIERRSPLHSRYHLIDSIGTELFCVTGAGGGGAFEITTTEGAIGSIHPLLRTLDSDTVAPSNIFRVSFPRELETDEKFLLLGAALFVTGL